MVFQPNANFKALVQRVGHVEVRVVVFSRTEKYLPVESALVYAVLSGFTAPCTTALGD